MTDNLGPCCLCEALPGDKRNPVRNLWMLPRQIPDGRDQAKGWGCFGCELKMGGAMAVLCDRCAAFASEWNEESWRLLKHYCTGPDSRDRAPIAELFDRPAWAHDMSKHPESDRRTSSADSI